MYPRTDDSTVQQKLLRKPLTKPGESFDTEVRVELRAVGDDVVEPLPEVIGIVTVKHA